MDFLDHGPCLAIDITIYRALDLAVYSAVDMWIHVQTLVDQCVLGL